MDTASDIYSTEPFTVLKYVRYRHDIMLPFGEEALDRKLQVWACEAEQESVNCLLTDGLFLGRK